MKQLKFILITAIVVVTVNSCSSDRDDEANQASAARVELKPLKIEKSNNQGTETSKTGDTVVIGPSTSTTSPGTGLEPTDPNDPEIIPPGDVKPPKGK